MKYRPGQKLRVKFLDNAIYHIAWAEQHSRSHKNLYKVENVDENAYFKKYVGLYAEDELEGLFEPVIAYNQIWNELNV